MSRAAMRKIGNDMTREEYYKQRRIFRAAISSITRSHLTRMPEDERNAVWDLFWEGIYMRVPKIIFDSMYPVSRGFGSWGISNSSKIRCNYSYCPNSYPHKTRNP